MWDIKPVKMNSTNQHFHNQFESFNYPWKAEALRIMASLLAHWNYIFFKYEFWVNTTSQFSMIWDCVLCQTADSLWAQAMSVVFPAILEIFFLVLCLNQATRTTKSAVSCDLSGLWVILQAFVPDLPAIKVIDKSLLQLCLGGLWSVWFQNLDTFSTSRAMWRMLNDESFPRAARSIQ